MTEVNNEGLLKFIEPEGYDKLTCCYELTTTYLSSSIAMRLKCLLCRNKRTIKVEILSSLT